MAETCDISSSLNSQPPGPLPPASGPFAAPPVRSTSTSPSGFPSPAPSPPGSDSAGTASDRTQRAWSFDRTTPTSSSSFLPGPRDPTAFPRASGSGRPHRVDRPRHDVSRRPDLRPFGLRQVVAGQGRACSPPRRRDSPVYVEATARETEARILSGLRKKFPDLPTNLGLAQTIARSAARAPLATRTARSCSSSTSSSSGSMPSGQEQDTELVPALRQCDGEHVQCLVLVATISGWRDPLHGRRTNRDPPKATTRPRSIFSTSSTPAMSR